MTIQIKSVNELVKELYNGTILAVKNIIPLEATIGAPKLIAPPITINFGVMIGFTGGMKGELILRSDPQFIGKIGEKLFGTPLSGDMLESFAGELGNMIAGNLATYLAKKELRTDITHPTVLKGDAQLSGFKRALLVEADYLDNDRLAIYLLLNQ